MEQKELPETDVIDPSVEDATLANASHKKKFRWLITILIIIFLAAVLIAFLLVKAKESSTSNTDSAMQQTVVPQSKGSVFCVKVGLDSLQCEELDAKELRKYKLSETFEGLSDIASVSPDESKFLVTGWQDSDTPRPRYVLSVFNDRHEQIATVPNPENRLYAYDIEWLNSDTLVYLTDPYVLDGQSTIMSFTVSTAKEAVFLTLPADIERIMPSGDDQFIYGIQAQSNSASNSIARTLVVIDVQAQKVIGIENGALEIGKDSLAYDVATQKFYSNVLRQEEQEYDIEVYRVDNLDTRPEFVLAGKIKDVYAEGPLVYRAVTTEKGIFATQGMLEWKAPLKLYSEDGTSTELALAAGYYGSGIILSLSSFPNFIQNETSTITARDLFEPAEGTPQKIIDFVDGLIEKAEGCGQGEYASYVIDAYDQVGQFGLSKAGCGDSIGSTYYRLQGDSYVEFARSGAHGFDCEERDRLGISAEVLPSCRMPGEGL